MAGVYFKLKLDILQDVGKYLKKGWNSGKISLTPIISCSFVILQGLNRRTITV
ncbi:hypothetical protein SAMN04488514_102410 [Kriegella aquimaris]|uniref:Uncharacterized protein n=1 Tax=Kriegella aquimaris TaxID=192904 RepID=A0A1G9M7W8_9FLAO|nr:hypothetical protein SAMN04488514_102410 [Kriegella aquimaris]